MEVLLLFCLFLSTAWSYNPSFDLFNQFSTFPFLMDYFEFIRLYIDIYKINQIEAERVTITNQVLN